MNGLHVGLDAGLQRSLLLPEFPVLADNVPFNGAQIMAALRDSIQDVGHHGIAILRSAWISPTSIRRTEKSRIVRDEVSNNLVGLDQLARHIAAGLRKLGQAGMTVRVIADQ